MEDLGGISFLFENDLVEQDRDYIHQILYRRPQGGKTVLEFIPQSPAGQASMSQAAVGDEHVFSAVPSSDQLYYNNSYQSIGGQLTPVTGYRPVSMESPNPVLIPTVLWVRVPGDQPWIPATSINSNLVQNRVMMTVNYPSEDPPSSHAVVSTPTVEIPYTSAAAGEVPWSNHHAADGNTSAAAGEVPWSNHHAADGNTSAAAGEVPWSNHHAADGKAVPVTEYKATASSDSLSPSQSNPTTKTVTTNDAAKFDGQSDLANENHTSGEEPFPSDRDETADSRQELRSESVPKQEMMKSWSSLFKTSSDSKISTATPEIRYFKVATDDVRLSAIENEATTVAEDNSMASLVSMTASLSQPQAAIAITNDPTKSELVNERLKDMQRPFEPDGSRSPEPSCGEQSSYAPAPEQESKCESLQSPKEETKLWTSLFRRDPAVKTATNRRIEDERRNELNEREFMQQMERAIAESKELCAAGKTEEKTIVSSRINMDVSVKCDPLADSLAAAVGNYVLVDRGPSFVLRGIVNRGNWCYVNATLQALLACPTFFQFLRHVGCQQRSPSSTPLLDVLTRLVSEFILVQDKGRQPKSSSRRRQNEETPLDPAYLRDIVCQLSTDSSFKGRQEDAEEFLLLVLNRLHEELAAILTSKKEPAGSTSNPASHENEVNGTADDNEWKVAGPGRASAITTRQVKCAQSPISDIFSGQLSYSLTPNQRGAEKSANLEPFFTLPLDVQLDGVTDLASALQALTSRELVENFQVKGKTEVDATRRVTFYELPRVLIFQLKYFVYSADCSEKIIKDISYPMNLKIDNDMLFCRGKTIHHSFYKLFAVVFHHGKQADGGHYTADVFHGGRWINVDDTKMTPVESDHVLAFHPPRVPYLLFYRRMEIANSGQSAGDKSGGVKRIT